MRLVADTLPGEDGEPTVTWAFEAGVVSGSS